MVDFTKPPSQVPIHTLEIETTGFTGEASRDTQHLLFLGLYDLSISLTSKVLYQLQTTFSGCHAIHSSHERIWCALIRDFRFYRFSL
jgi:hypothetical protein